MMNIITADKTPQELYWYACDVLKARWPEAEPIIAEDSEWAYWYAYNVLKARWPEAEPYIMKSPEYSLYYACRVLKIRWPEAEEIIMSDEYSGTLYNNFVLTCKNISEYERTLFQLEYSEYLC